jgi:hypothetical protein
MDHIALRIEFVSDWFKQSGPLPARSNAGNQFYGEDLAKWICETLPAWKLGYMDEDWGWLVFSTHEHRPADERHSICVYAFSCLGPAYDFGQWMLMVHSEFRHPWFRYFHRWRKGCFDARLGADLIQALQQLGVRNLQAAYVTFDAAGNAWDEVPYRV